MNSLKTIDIPENIDWELFRRFDITTKSNSFNEAADRVGTSHGALLKQLNTLEKKLNTKLFIRTAKQRTLNLTVAGEDLKKITEQMGNLLHKNFYQKLPRKNIDEIQYLKIITTAGLSTTLLPPMLEDFLKLTKKNINLELITHHLPRSIEIGEVIIRNDFMNQGHLKSINLNTLNLSFYASQRYIDIYGIPHSNEDLENHKILSVKYFKISSVDKILDPTNYLYPEFGIQSEYISFLIEMALRNFGIIELPDIHPAVKDLVKIPDLKSTKVKIHAGYLDIIDQTEIVYDFIKHLSASKNYNS